MRNPAQTLQDNSTESVWKKGPLPKETWGWGGIIIETNLNQTGKPVTFLNASFRGIDAVASGVVIPANKILWYCNPIQDLPKGEET